MEWRGWTHIGLLRGAVELLERLELVDERLVLRLEHRHAVLERLHVALLLEAALARRLSAQRTRTRTRTVEHSRRVRASRVKELSRMYCCSNTSTSTVQCN